jgi:hypothetical protein
MMRSGGLHWPGSDSSSHPESHERRRTGYEQHNFFVPTQQEEFIFGKCSGALAPLHEPYSELVTEEAKGAGCFFVSFISV